MDSRLNDNKDGPPKKPKVLAISSGGGHWIQLLRLRPAFENCHVIFATVDEGYRCQVDGAEFRAVPDANRWDKFSLLHSAAKVLLLMMKERPEVVISTGAAPGFFAVRFAKFFGARTIWVDSIANAERLSLSGEKVQYIADLCLTQWPHLAKEDGPFFKGNVL